VLWNRARSFEVAIDQTEKSRLSPNMTALMIGETHCKDAQAFLNCVIKYNMLERRMWLLAADASPRI